MLLTWLLAVGGVAILLAVLLHFVGPSKTLKIPGVGLGAICGLGAGAALAIAAMGVYGESIRSTFALSDQAADGGADQAAAAKSAGGAGGAGPSQTGQPKAPNRPDGPAKGAFSKKGGGGAGPASKGMGGPGGGGRGPNSKTQLANLVTKLDQLTAKPLTVSLSADQKAKLQDQLAGLGEAKELSSDEAKERLEKVLEIVKPQRETLEAAGYRWPGDAGGSQPPPDLPSPFASDANKQHLSSLLKTLAPADKQ